jgi:hypothetical protein
MRFPATVLTMALASTSVDACHRSEHAAATGAFGRDERLATIHTRPGVTLPFDLLEPEGAPRACAVLLAGGDGKLSLSSRGIGSGTDNFMVRTRQRFARAGFTVAVVDAPSDRPEGLDGFRTSEAHAGDLRALVDWLHAKRRCSVWLVGTSRGTISAANVVARTGATHVAGLVLTSSVTAGPKESLAEVAVDHIPTPTLLVHHRQDACKASPPSGAPLLEARLASAPRKELRMESGGEAPSGDVCGPRSHHGYWGEDEEVVRAITLWMGAGG